MPIVAADLIAYNCLNRPTDDTSTGGGAIDPDVRPSFTQLTANDDTEAVSTSASDTGTLTINGRAATGATNSTTIVLAGTTVVTNATIFERILDVTNSVDAVGTVTYRRQPSGATIFTIVPTERGCSALFKRSTSESGIAIRYDKTFWRNAHASLTLNDAKVRLTADPDARIRQGVHTAKGDTATIANRKAAPAGVTFVDDNVDQAVPTDTLAASENIGVWWEENLPASDPAHRTTFTSQLSGTTI